MFTENEYFEGCVEEKPNVRSEESDAVGRAIIAAEKVMREIADVDAEIAIRQSKKHILLRNLIHS